MNRLMVVAGLLIVSVASFAQVAEMAVSGGVSLLKNNELVPGAELGDGWRFGFRVALNTYRFMGHEVGYAYNRTDLKITDVETVEYGMAIHQGFYNFLLYALPEGSPVRPFVTGGGHFSNYVPPGASAASGQGATKFGLNYGGGIKARMGSKFMVRVDVRQYHTPKPDFFVQAPEGWLRQTEISAGFGVAF